MELKEISKPKRKAALKIISSWLDYQSITTRWPGFSVGISSKNELIFAKGYGWADLEAKKAATEQTIYRVASISKTFTAVAIMQLVEAGKLQLDDKVGKYLKWFKIDNQVTIRQLLTHSGGVTRDGNTPHWEDHKFPTLDVIKRQIRADVSVYTDNERFKYSNFGFSLLGQVIEAITGQTYRDYAFKNIIKPVKLDHTGPDYDPTIDELAARGYGREITGYKRLKFPHIPTNAMASATGFYSTAEDLCRYMSALLPGTGKLLSDASKREMFRVQWATTDKEPKRCLAFGPWYVDDVKLLGHSGGFPGFITKIGFSIENQLGIAVLTNAGDGDPIYLLDGIAHIINFVDKNFDDLKDFSAKERDLRKYVGRFYSTWGEFETAEINNALIGYYPAARKIFEMPYKFKPTADNEFEIKTGDPFDNIGEKMRYEFDNSGRLKQVLFGPNPMVPFESGLSRLKRAKPEQGLA